MVEAGDSVNLDVWRIRPLCFSRRSIDLRGIYFTIEEDDEVEEEEVCEWDLCDVEKDESLVDMV